MRQERHRRSGGTGSLTANPFERLIAEMRAAARFVHAEAARALAAREAREIPPTFCEKMHTRKGDLARQARALMRALPATRPEDFANVAAHLVFLADALATSERGQIAGEVRRSQRPRHPAGLPKG